jgi:hypothetical protein
MTNDLTGALVVLRCDRCAPAQRPALAGSDEQHATVHVLAGRLPTGRFLWTCFRCQAAKDTRPSHELVRALSYMVGTAPLNKSRYITPLQMQVIGAYA